MVNILYPRGRSAQILHVEDDDVSHELMRVCLNDSLRSHHLSRVTNGEEAMRFLRRSGSFSKAPRPDLIFLDLHMPIKDGRAFLREVKADRSLKRIPVIVITGSAKQSDINSVYDLHANCYLRKPKSLQESSRQIRLIEEFWFGVVLWPTTETVESAGERLCVSAP